MRVGIVQRKDNKIVPGTVFPLFDRLNGCGAEIILPSKLRDFYVGYDGKVVYSDDDMMNESPDIIFVLGGDGSIISTVRDYPDIPVIGINFGTLAYLAELEITELDLVDKIVSGDYTVEERVMLEAKIIRNDGTVSMTRPAFNDIVLSNGPLPHVISFDMFINGQFAQTYKSDGVVVATPSGSTAYSMSAGGPVLDPGLDSIVVTPICPHIIFQRPIVLSSSVEICIRGINWRKDNVYLSADGDEVLEVVPGDVIVIKRSDRTAKLAHIKNSQFVNKLNEKMGVINN